MIRLSNSSWRRYCEAILCFVTRSLTRVETVHTRRHTHTLPGHRFGHRSRRTPSVEWPKLAQVHTLAADILDLCCGALATGMKLIYLVTVNLSPFWLATRPAHSWQSPPPLPQPLEAHYVDIERGAQGCVVLFFAPHRTTFLLLAEAALFVRAVRPSGR